MVANGLAVLTGGRYFPHVSFLTVSARALELVYKCSGSAKDGAAGRGEKKSASVRCRLLVGSGVAAGDGGVVGATGRAAAVAGAAAVLNADEAGAKVPVTPAIMAIHLKVASENAGSGVAPTGAWVRGQSVPVATAAAVSETAARSPVAALSSAAAISKLASSASGLNGTAIPVRGSNTSWCANASSARRTAASNLGRVNVRVTSQ